VNGYIWGNDGERWAFFPFDVFGFRWVFSAGDWLSIGAFLRDWELYFKLGMS